VAAHYRENADGEETAREAVETRNPKGYRVTTAAKTEDSGEERKVKRGYPKKEYFLGPHSANASRIAP
jgi:hypothetical protein